MIRLTVPALDESEVQAVREVLLSGYLVQGARVAEFERVVAELSELPGFMTDWRERVVLPPFAPCETVVYARSCDEPIA